jgi:hypothetical protein
MSWSSREVDSFPVVLRYRVGEAGGEGVTSSRKGGIGVGNMGLASDRVYGTIGWMSSFIPRSTAVARTGIDMIPHSIEGGVIIMLSVSFPVRGFIGFFFLFFLASADVAAGPLWIATWAAVEVFWGASLEVVSADMGGMFSVKKGSSCIHTHQPTTGLRLPWLHSLHPPTASP